MLLYVSILEWVKAIEPGSSNWEAEVQPLNYTRFFGYPFKSKYDSGAEGASISFDGYKSPRVVYVIIEQAQILWY